MSGLSSAFLMALGSFGSAWLVGMLPFLYTRTDHQRWLDKTTSLAAGFLLGAAFLIAIPEGLEALEQLSHAHQDEPHGEGISLESAGLLLLLGFVFMMVMESFGFGHDFHEEQHDHEAHHGHDHVNHPTSAATVISTVIGLTVHAFVDGLVIGAAIAHGELAISLSIFIVIMMHKIPASFSVAAFSLHERHNRRNSYFDLLYFCLATPIAILLSWMFLRGQDADWLGLILLFSAGTFIYVATVDVLPSMHTRSQSKSVVPLVLAGIAVVYLITLVIAAMGGHHH